VHVEIHTRIPEDLIHIVTENCLTQTEA